MFISTLYKKQIWKNLFDSWGNANHCNFFFRFSTFQCLIWNICFFFVNSHFYIYIWGSLQNYWLTHWKFHSSLPCVITNFKLFFSGWCCVRCSWHREREGVRLHRMGRVQVRKLLFLVQRGATHLERSRGCLQGAKHVLCLHTLGAGARLPKRWVITFEPLDAWPSIYPLTLESICALKTSRERVCL